MTVGPAGIVILAASATFLVGACIGSFLNVVIYRLPRGESIVSPRSRCPGCGRQIGALENIPIISFIALGGKCAGCGVAISWRYPAVELLTAVGFAAIFLLDGPGFPLLRDLLFLSLLIPITFIDIDHRIIPDELSLGGLAAGILLSFLPGGDWKGSITGALVGWEAGISRWGRGWGRFSGGAERWLRSSSARSSVLQGGCWRCERAGR